MFSRMDIRARGDFEKLRLKEHEYALRRLAEMPDREAIDGAIERWWKESLPIMKSALDGKSESNVSYSFASEVGGTLPRPSQYILDAGVQLSLELATAIDWVIDLAPDDIHLDNDEIGVAWYVLAEATAPLVAREMDVLVFQLFHRMCTNRSKEMSQFDDVFVKECAEPDNHSYWLTALSRPADLSAFSDAWNRKSSPGQYDGLLVDWLSNTNPFVLLSGWRNMVDFEGFPLVRLDYLRKLNQIKWLEAVEALPLPEMQYQALTCLEDEPDSILDVLRDAEGVLNKDGDWNRKTVAVHTLRIALALVEGGYLEIARSVDVNFGSKSKTDEDSGKKQLRTLLDGDISDWLGTLLKVLIAREDGKTLAVELAAHVFVNYLRLLDENRGPDTLPLYERFLDISIQNLMSGGFPPEFAVEQGKRHVVWEDEQNRCGSAFRAHGLHFVLIAIQVIDGTKTSDAQSNDSGNFDDVRLLNPQFGWLWEKAIVPIVKKDLMPSLLLNGSHFKGQQTACYQLGRVLASLDKPAQGFKEGWRALNQERQEAIERRQDYSDGDAALKFMVFIGFGAISALIDSKRDVPRELSEKLWNALLAAMQSMLLMQIIDTSLTWKDIYAYGIAVLGIQFPSGDPILDQAVAFVSNDREMVKPVKALLEANGWESLAVSELLARNGVA